MTMYAADSNTGHRREHNEDSYALNPDLGLWLVADGVGGHADGEVASAIVCETILADVASGSSLIDAILHSHDEVLDEIHSRGDSNMGSTVVVLRVQGAEYEIAWVGDSRAYVFDGELRQLTRDHNPVSEMLARGAITPEQAANHPERNVLTQSLGVSDEIDVAPERLRGTLEAGQQIILCSDGLTDELNDDEITDRMKNNGTPQEQVDALVAGALDAGGRDNVTVVVVNASSDLPLTAEKPGKPSGHTTQELASVDAEELTQGSGGQHNTKMWLLLAAMVSIAVLVVLNLG